MRIRFALVAGALAALVLSAAGCTVLTSADATTVESSSTVWQMAPSLAGAEWERLPTTRKLVALTFDAGSGNEGVASILATLAEKNVPATFFLKGQWAEAFPADAKAIADRYPVGNQP